MAYLYRFVTFQEMINSSKKKKKKKKTPKEISKTLSQNGFHKHIPS